MSVPALEAQKRLQQGNERFVSGVRSLEAMLSHTRRAELASLRSKLPARTDVVERTLVTAQIDGIVMNVRVTTESGVVRPGEALLEIVPQNASLIVDARVRPIDVDVVRPGMGAKVVFSAFAQRNLPQIDGRLRSTGGAYPTLRVVAARAA